MKGGEVSGKILIASDLKAEAESLQSQLATDYQHVSVSIDPEHYVEDFERFEPDVLLLVFDKIENAQSYYLGLYRFGSRAQQHSHRTIVFCSKEQVKKAFQLCQKQYFDDYVLFWPSPYDGSRLPMSIHVALRELKQYRRMSSSERQLGDYARKLKEFSHTLQQSLASGELQVESTMEHLADNGARLSAAIEHLLGRVSGERLGDGDAVHAAPGLESELRTIVSHEIGPLVESARIAVEPLRHWASELQRESSMQLGQTEAFLSALASGPRQVLVVDDDEFTQKVVGTVLERGGYEAISAGSGIEALNLLRKIRPSLILMDYMLPDEDGVEITRRLKQSQEFAAIPVIMLTGHSSRDIVIRSLAAGAADFLAKPLKPNILLAKVGKYAQL
jgi:CheY-like chemotaxis protein